MEVLYCNDCFTHVEKKKIKLHQKTKTCSRYRKVTFRCDCSFETKGLKNIQNHLYECKYSVEQQEERVVKEKNSYIVNKEQYDLLEELKMQLKMEITKNKIFHNIINNNTNINVDDIIVIDGNVMKIFDKENSINPIIFYNNEKIPEQEVPCYVKPSDEELDAEITVELSELVDSECEKNINTVDKELNELVELVNVHEESGKDEKSNEGEKESGKDEKSNEGEKESGKDEKSNEGEKCMNLERKVMIRDIDIDKHLDELPGWQDGMEEFKQLNMLKPVNIDNDPLYEGTPKCKKEKNPIQTLWRVPKEKKDVFKTPIVGIWKNAPKEQWTSKSPIPKHLCKSPKPMPLKRNNIKYTLTSKMITGTVSEDKSVEQWRKECRKIDTAIRKFSSEYYNEIHVIKDKLFKYITVLKNSSCIDFDFICNLLYKITELRIQLLPCMTKDDYIVMVKAQIDMFQHIFEKKGLQPKEYEKAITLYGLSQWESMRIQYKDYEQTPVFNGESKYLNAHYYLQKYYPKKYVIFNVEQIFYDISCDLISCVSTPEAFLEYVLVNRYGFDNIVYLPRSDLPVVDEVSYGDKTVYSFYTLQKIADCGTRLWTLDRRLDNVIEYLSTNICSQLVYEFKKHYANIMYSNSHRYSDNWKRNSYNMINYMKKLLEYIMIFCQPKVFRMIIHNIILEKGVYKPSVKDRFHGSNDSEESLANIEEDESDSYFLQDTLEKIWRDIELSEVRKEISEMVYIERYKDADDYKLYKLAYL